MASPVPGFSLLPADAVEKWHSQSDIDDPPFKRPMLAQMAHLDATNRSKDLAGEQKRVREHISGVNHQLLVILVAVASLLIGIAAGSLAPINVVALMVGVIAAVLAAPLFFALRARHRLVTGLAKLESQKLAADKEAEEHWNKFVKLTTEADSKIKVLEDAPVVSTTTPPSGLSEEN